MFNPLRMGPLGMLMMGDGRPDSSSDDLAGLTAAYAAARKANGRPPPAQGPDFMDRLRSFAAAREPNGGSAAPGGMGAGAPQAAPPAPVRPGMGSPNEMVAQGFNALGPSPLQTAVQTPSPLPGNTPPPPALSAQAMVPPPPAAPMPAPSPPQAPQAPPEMNFFQRNSAMMQDPSSGAFIDPTNAKRAQASGPDVINKLLQMFHSKDA